MECVRSGEPGEMWGAGSGREEIEASEAGGCFQEEEKRKRERRACIGEGVSKSSSDRGHRHTAGCVTPGRSVGNRRNLHRVPMYLGVGTVPRASMVLEPAPVSLSP